MPQKQLAVAKIRNLAELVRALAEIASQTTDADTAQRLMTDAGVPLGPDLPPASRNSC